MNLPDQWIDRIFLRLQGIYGQQFTGKFSRMENGVDVGLVNAKVVWADELGNFLDLPEAIGYALKHLPSEKCPNAMEFRDICRRAPRKDETVAQVEYKPSAEDIARHRELSHKATAAVKAKEFDGLLWAKRPKSQVALNAIYDGKKHPSRFPALAAIFDQLVADGVATAEGKLLNRWDGVRWSKV